MRYVKAVLASLIRLALITFVLYTAFELGGFSIIKKRFTRQPNVSGFTTDDYKELSKDVFKLSNAPNQIVGTAFAIITMRGNPFLVTNAHVCNGAFGTPRLLYASQQLFVTEQFAEVIISDESTDLCLLTAPFSLDDEGNRHYHLETALPLFMASTKRNVNDTYITAGHPAGGSLQTEAYLNVREEAYFITRQEAPCSFIDKRYTLTQEQKDACEIHLTGIVLNHACIPGSSGSPLVNETRGLIGVIDATSIQMDECYALPVETLQALVESIEGQ